MHRLAAIVFLAVAAPALAQDRNFDKVEIKVSRVAGSVYMLEGSGGNIGASIGDDGIVLVDDQFAPLVEKIRAALAGITQKPIRFVINTHHHGDHTGGNALLQKISPVIAQDNVRKRLASGDAGALPIITFEHDVTVHLNGEDVRALHVPSGHTDGDAVIFFPKSNVVHLGDDFVTYGFPFVDVAAGGSVKGMIEGVEAVIAQLPPDVKVIPGHGPISTLDDVRRFVTMLKDTRAAVEKALAGGQKPEELKASPILDPWKSYSGDFVTSEKWLQTLLTELTGRKPGPFVQHN